MTSGIIMREKGKNKKDVVIETSRISPMTFLTKSVKSRSRYYCTIGFVQYVILHRSRCAVLAAIDPFYIKSFVQFSFMIF